MSEYELLLASVQEASNSIAAKVLDLLGGDNEINQILDTFHRNVAFYKRTKDFTVFRDQQKDLQNHMKAKRHEERDSSKENIPDDSNLSTSIPKKESMRPRRQAFRDASKNMAQLNVKVERVSSIQSQIVDDYVFYDAEALVKAESVQMPPPVTIPIKGRKPKKTIKSESDIKEKKLSTRGRKKKTESLSRDSDVIFQPMDIVHIDLESEADENENIVLSDAESDVRSESEEVGRESSRTHPSKVSDNKRSKGNTMLVDLDDSVVEVNTGSHVDEVQSEEVVKRRVGRHAKANIECDEDQQKTKTNRGTKVSDVQKPGDNEETKQSSTNDNLEEITNNFEKEKRPSKETKAKRVTKPPKTVAEKDTEAKRKPPRMKKTKVSTEIPVETMQDFENFTNKQSINLANGTFVISKDVNGMFEAPNENAQQEDNQVLINTYLQEMHKPSLVNNEHVLNHTQVVTESVFNGTLVISKNQTPSILSNEHAPKHITNEQVLNETQIKPSNERVMNVTQIISSSNLSEIKDKDLTRKKKASSVYEDAVEQIPEINAKQAAGKVKKGAKQVFNPFENSPVKKKVEAFEKLGALSVDSPTRTTRTKTRLKAKAREAENEASQKKVSHIPVLEPKGFTPSVNHIMPSYSVASASKAMRHVQCHVAPSKTLSALKASQLEFREREQRRKEKEAEAQNKKDAMLRMQIEEKKKKREEREQKARLLREAQDKEKLKLLELQVQRDEKYKQQQLEKQAKLQRAREESEKKRQLVKQRNEEMKRGEEMAKTDEEAVRKFDDRQKIQEVNERWFQKKQQIIKTPKKPIYLTEPAPLLPTYDCYDSGDEEGQKKTAKVQKPDWLHSAALKTTLSTMHYIDTKLTNTFFSLKPQTANLMEIFPGIDPQKLRRNSSAIWKHPPRYTLMPKK